MNKEKLFNRQIETLECNKKVLNILPGEVLLADFMDNELCLDGSLYVPFNEIVCDGEVTSEIFSSKFITARAKSLNVSEDFYKIKISEFLTSVDKKDYDIVHLWFGTDMNCIMNLVTVLAYFEQKGINKKFFITFINDETEEISGLLTEVELGDWVNIYNSAFFDCKLYSSHLPTMFINGINNYLKFKCSENELTQFIKENDHLSKDALIKHFMKYRNSLGLTDFTYSRLIDSVRNN